MERLLRWAGTTVGMAAVAAVVLSGNVRASSVQVVPWVDLDRYLGTWHEIGSFPQWFQRGCTGTTATYSRLEDGRIRVVNRCLRDGRLSTTEGVAWVADPSTNAKLKVRFFWPFAGDYWIVSLDPDYRWAAVSDPDRDTLWILSRTPSMDEATFRRVVDELARRGWDMTRLQVTAPLERETGRVGTMPSPPPEA